ncbi:fatty acid desaturase [Paenibacillus shunpengii]|uniref:Fatty acid desaturase n=1 Tax=Paenibacillus shunpengii TaxID=2054424 RepID=A0ABW5SH89_9BACL|nr:MULTISPECIES: fatty acid desaturase [unclassified Paenibacillus]OMC72126.1 fatty acid desaturase [Paenibacillus sp. FSL H7-0326]SDX36080.1 omega-6 fatty acid desaturase (delta-12 desaturase) [Paenibacillus sp. PDC88]
MSASFKSQLKKEVAPYEKTELKSSIIQMVNTLIPLFVLWYLAYASLSVSYWLSLPISLIAAGFVIRTFIIFHDCCHGSFFKNKKANNIVGTLTGVISLTPYMQWKYSHSVHHASSGNLDKRGIGDIWMMTVTEYNESPWYTKFYYRVYRNPIILFGIGPIAVFLLQYRFNRRGAKRKERLNTYLTNLLIVIVYALLILAIGWKAFLLVQVPIFYFASMLGIWLFYVQHTFEDSYFENEDEWSYIQAAVEGSSYYKLPKPLQWITGNIGFHHVHHLSPRVPNYHLEEAHNATPPLQQATTITVLESFKAMRFRLWNEDMKRFVTFRQYKKGQRLKERAQRELAEKKAAAI